MNLQFAELMLNYPNYKQMPKPALWDMKYSFYEFHILIDFWSNGYLKAVRFVKNGATHRPRQEGPALIWYSSNGEIFSQEFREDGVKCSEKSDK